jgi:hypothetical protein
MHPPEDPHRLDAEPDEQHDPEDHAQACWESEFKDHGGYLRARRRAAMLRVVRRADARLARRSPMSPRRGCALARSRLGTHRPGVRRTTSTRAGPGGDDPGGDAGDSDHEVAAAGWSA